MTDANTAKLAEIDSNLETFLELLPELLHEHSEDYVLMRHQDVVGYYSSAIDAQVAGNQQFGDHIFSIQHVREAAEELGRYSYAIPARET
jgi:hypothetical protein